MPRRRAAGGDMEEAEEEAVEVVEEAGNLQKLKFSEPLTWRAGKTIPVADLLKRLQALSKELRGLEQEDVDRDSILGPAKELANHNLVLHKDKGIKAWTACCLVDIFRLCAPDAPYTASQLKDIFTLIVDVIIPALADPSNPYNQQHLYVLQSLTEVKSIVLLTDIPSAHSLIHRLFAACFDVLSGPSKAESGEELSKNVEHHMTSLLGVLLDEAQGLPQPVVDVILAQFLRADPRSVANANSRGKKAAPDVKDKQTTLLLKEAPPAYNMAKNICNSAPEKMAQYLLHYFSQVLLSATDSKALNGRDVYDDDGEAAKSLSEADFNESRKAHSLLKELWRSCPSILQSIIPQLESELLQEDVQLRLLATEAVGDMVSGIGAAGPPQLASLQPSVYPSQSIASASQRPQTYNFLTTPSSPLSFTAKYPQAFQSFVSRRNDKSSAIRASWTTAIGRILVTSAGGVGLDQDIEYQLLQYLAEMLVDADEKVRLSAIKAIESFTWDDIMQKITRKGGVLDSGSILANLADRVKDKKPPVRSEAIKLLGRMWGVASGAIAEGSERTNELLGPAASKVLEACYINDPELTACADRALFESLLPLDYPPIKAKEAQLANGSSKRNKDSEVSSSHVEQKYSEADVDRIRAERELILIRGLDSRAKPVFWVKGRFSQNARFMEAFLKQCEEYNGGVPDKQKDAKKVKENLGKLIDYLAKTLPDPSRVTEDLWKFARLHDRRAYHLIRFCMSPKSEYSKIRKSIKEFTKRLESAGGSTATLIDTMTILLYRASVLLFNRSHVPAIIEFSRTNDKGLSATAHEVLKEISSSNPEVLEAHTGDLCRSLETDAPSSKRASGSGAVADLRACSSFAKKFPKEISKDRPFQESLKAYVMFGSPPEAAKYAVSIIMVNVEKKKIHTKELLSACLKGFIYGKDHYLSRLAALSQLMLAGSSEQIDPVYDTVQDIAISQVLLKPVPSKEGEKDAAANSGWTDAPDEHCLAKIWALRLLVNRLRATPADEDPIEVAKPIYQLLNKLIQNVGQLSDNMELPQSTASRLRLSAAQLMLKLCCEKRFDSLLTPSDFNHLATVAQDAHQPVREGFVRKVMKYLRQNKLPHRFYAILFLLAFEPARSIKDDTVNFIRARNLAYAKQKSTAMEGIFARVLSLLAHHPDFDASDEEGLKDFARYILFYLKCVARDENLSLIFHVAQRIKSVRDGIDSAKSGTSAISPHSRNLYILSDMAQTIVRRYEEQRGWSLQSYPAKLKLPGGLFASLPSHEISQEIASKQFLSEDVAEAMEAEVKDALKAKKRKYDGGSSAVKRQRTSGEGTSAKAKSSSVKRSRPVKTPRAGRLRDGDASSVVASSATRRSSRGAKQANYFESSEGEENGDVDVDMADTLPVRSHTRKRDDALAEPGSEAEAGAEDDDSEEENPQQDEPIEEVTSPKGKTRGQAKDGSARKASPKSSQTKAAKSTESPRPTRGSGRTRK